MAKESFENRDFKDQNYSIEGLPLGTYENCLFNSCIFNASDISESTFMDCKFEHCDLSMANVNGTAFKEVRFTHCKLLGLHFEECNPFLLKMYFHSCIMNYSSFVNVKLRHTKFVECKMEEVDFTQADLSSAIFKDCELAHAIFENTILDKADLRSANNISLDPELNQIYQAKFSMQSALGLLKKYQIIIE